MEAVTFDQISNLIMNGFFPVVMCFVLLWVIVNQMEKLRDVVDNNTKAIIEMTAVTKQFHEKE